MHVMSTLPILLQWYTFHYTSHAQGNYDKAIEFFDRCCKICTELNDIEALHLARVHYGVAKSHQLIGKYSSFINDETSHTLQKLVLWKDTRIVPLDELDSHEQSGGEKVEGFRDSVSFPAPLANTEGVGNDDGSLT